MINVKRGHKLCLNCKSSYETKCTSPKCKYTIEKYKSASKHMKLKTIDYLRKTNQKFYLCRICHNIVTKEHFESQEHIDTFHTVVSIEVKRSFKNSFLSIKTQFTNTTYNAIYTYLYFKKHVKDIIFKNIEVNKYYKSYFLTKNMILFNYQDHQMFHSEKYNSNDIINDINNIEHLEKKQEYLKPQLINTNTSDYDYNLDKMLEDLDLIHFKKSGDSIKYFHHMGCDIKLMMCDLLRGGEYNYEKIPKLFHDSKIVTVIKNKDNKCFLYCYIRKFHNNPKKHKERISYVDKELVKKLKMKRITILIMLKLNN